MPKTLELKEYFHLLYDNKKSFFIFLRLFKFFRMKHEEKILRCSFYNFAYPYNPMVKMCKQKEKRKTKTRENL